MWRSWPWLALLALAEVAFVAVASGFESEGAEESSRALQQEEDTFIDGDEICVATFAGSLQQWLVGPNATVERGSAIAVLQTSNGTRIITSPYHGMVIATQVNLVPGSWVDVGDNMVRMKVYSVHTLTPAPQIVYRESSWNWGSFGRLLFALLWICLIILLLIGCLLWINKAVIGGDNATNMLGSLLEKQPLLRRNSDVAIPVGDGGVLLKFATQPGLMAEKVVIRCEYRPLGIIFPRKLPVTVSGFHHNSYAKSLGVHPGWTLTKIADMDVSRADSMSFEHVEGVLLDALSDLPVWPLRIICENEEGRTVPIQLNYKPLGISFIKKTPIVVDEFAFNSYAYEAGIQAGWRILAIGDEDVRDERYEIAEQVLMDSLASLPLWPLRIDFDTGHNHEVSKYFDYHPVGFTIKKHGHVDKVEEDGQADALGVKHGWTIVRLGSTETHNMKLSALQEMLDEGTMHLPDYGPVP
mmetsp:Transcript_8237/g.19370  ORF Transcript_8237/g.19370 Transcript_8237/m.19370 type:complete len:469 (-) Transcript_8237:38-1444(-)